MKHTPGPWKIEPYSHVDKWIEIGPGIRLDYDDVDHEEQDANALIIASAPDLLRCIEMIIDVRDKSMSTQDLYKVLLEISVAQNYLQEHGLIAKESNL